MSSIQLSHVEKKPEEAAKLLDAAEKQLGSTFAIRQHRFGALMQQDPDQLKPGLAKLEVGIEKLSKEEQRVFWYLLGQGYARADDYENSRRCWQAALALTPDDTKMLQKLFDLAHAYDDDKGMTQAQNQIGKVLGTDGDVYKYAQASRLIWEVHKEKKPKSALADAKKLVAEARQLRPEWHELLRLAGVMDELEGNFDGAIKNYKEAFDKGNEDSNMGRRLVRLLYAQGRAEEVPAYVRYVGRVPAGDPIERIVVEANFARNPEAAIKQARQTAEAADDAQTYLWLGTLLNRDKQSEEAQAAFRKAIEKDPKRPDARLMLVAQLMGEGQRSEAEEEIQAAAQDLPAEVAALTLARMNEMINDKESADEHYQAAIKQQPENVEALHSYATFLVRTNRKEEALAQYDRILAVKVPTAAGRGPSPAAPRPRWSRQRGDFTSLQKALAIIDENATEGKLTAEDVLKKSQLLATRPESALRGQSILLMEQLKQLRELSPTEQLTLAAMLEQSGQWKKARTEMEELLARRTTEHFIYLAAFAKMLLEHDEQIEEVGYLLDRLEKMKPNYEPARELRAWLLVKQEQPEEALAILKELEPKPPLSPAGINRLASLASVYEQLGFKEEAERMLRKYVAEEPRAVLALAAFVGRNGDIDEAFALYEDGRAAHEAEQIIQTAIYTLRQRPEDATGAHLSRIEGWIKEALEATEDVEAKYQLRLHIRRSAGARRTLRGSGQDLPRFPGEILGRSAAEGDH